MPSEVKTASLRKPRIYQTFLKHTSFLHALPVCYSQCFLRLAHIFALRESRDMDIQRSFVIVV